MKYRRIKAALIIVLFLTAGVLYSASRSQDIFLYDEMFYSSEAAAENREESGSSAGSPVGSAKAQTTAEIHVHVCGAVKKAGVYLLGQDSIVEDAIEAAGGILEGGAADYLNLAGTVSEGDKIYVPFLKDVEEPCGDAAQSSAGSDHMQSGQGTDSGRNTLVNINTADSTQLMTLSGIGETRAEAIIAYREANGNFQKIEDIMKVSGIKEGAFNKIRDQITV